MTKRCSCGVLVSLIDKADLGAHASACGLVVPGLVLEQERRRAEAELRRRQRYNRRARLGKSMRTRDGGASYTADGY